MAKINILVVVPSLHCGGLERNVALLCNNIDVNRFEITLVVINNAKPFFTIANPQIKTIDLGLSSARKSVFAIKRIAGEINPDIILTTANHLNIIFAALRWMFPSRIKIIARESSILSINVPTRWNVSFYKWIFRRYYHKIDWIVCQSAYMQSDLIENFDVPKDQTCIINNAVEQAMPFTGGSSDNSKSVPHFVTIARLSQEKGIERLIKSVAKLDMPFRYTIIGEGILKESLQQLILQHNLSEKVKLAGESSEPFALVKQPALLLMGSYFEGFPNVIIEANALGIPVVAFKAPGGIAEIIGDGKNGFIVEDDSDVAFANTIKKALSYPFNKNEIIANTAFRFSIEKIMQQWQQLFETACKKA